MLYSGIAVQEVCSPFQMVNRMHLQGSKQFGNFVPETHGAECYDELILTDPETQIILPMVSKLQFCMFLSTRSCLEPICKELRAEHHGVHENAQGRLAQMFALTVHVMLKCNGAWAGLR